MPRDLGKAKRSDLSGHFPGEQAEYGSAFSRFLEGAGQLKPLEDGTYLDSVSDNGNGRSTEVPGMPGRNGGHTDSGRTPADGNGASTDTEIGRSPVPDNGASDTVFDTQGGGFFDDDAMFPEPALNDQEMSLEPMQSLSPDTAELEPVEFEPSADTLSPTNEPATLESVPDLTSPELDASEDDEDDTDILDRDGGMPPPESSGDTGLLVAEAFGTEPVDRLSDADLDGNDEWSGLPVEEADEDRITDKVNRTPERIDDDVTSVFKEDGEVDEEKITNKVEPRRDVDPRSQDPNAVVRDTVNFYNQTQNFKEQKDKGGFPTISPTVVNSTQPLEINRERHDTMPLQREPEEAPELVENEPDLMPSAFADEPMSLDSMDQPEPSPDDGAQSLSPADSTLQEESTDTLRPGPALEPMSLDAEPIGLEAEGDIEDIDKRETDKFREEDRQPPSLPLPEGTDKVDKEQAERERAAGEELEPIADEKVAGGKDTQRFYVADILAKKPQPEESKHTGDTTAELQPAEQGLPDFASPSSETVADLTGEPTVDDRPTRIRTRDDLNELPTPVEVNTDFKTRSLQDASDRIVPELESEPENSDDTVDEEADAGALDKITDKLGPPPERDHTTRRRPVVPPKPEPVVANSKRVKRITDALSQRLRQEREETLRLIEEAEAVAVRLREASESSRADLLAISERRAAVQDGNGETHIPEGPEEQALEVAEEQPENDEFATAVLPEATVSARSGTTVSVPATQRNPNRVPTRAIGELVDDLKRTAVGTPSTLSELLAQVSEHAEPVEEEDDLDLLVAASSRLRETVEAAYEDDRISGRMPAIEDDSDYEPPRSEPEQPKPEAPGSNLSSDLDRLWKVLDSRRTATVVLPPADKARITRDDREDAEVMEGWTQEMLWPTMAGIAVVTFALGALFVWVLSRM